jgi:hypothetical protein
MPGKPGDDVLRVAGQGATMNHSTNKPPMISVYRGRDCVGFVFARGPQGYEAFDDEERPIGLFADEHAAAAAILNQRPVGAP